MRVEENAMVRGRQRKEEGEEGDEEEGEVEEKKKVLFDAEANKALADTANNDEGREQLEGGMAELLAPLEKKARKKSNSLQLAEGKAHLRRAEEPTHPS
jgi:hypothetical protein